MKKYLLGLLLLISTASHADDALPILKEAYIQYDRTVQIVISNKECVKWKPEAGVQLNYAYAINTETGETITGCFTHDSKHIIIELTDDVDGKKHYHFEFEPQLFQPRATL